MTDSLLSIATEVKACTQCHSKPPRDGMKTCQLCSDKAKERRRKRVERGGCLTCTRAPAQAGTGKCELCREAERRRRRYNPSINAASHKRYRIRLRQAVLNAYGGRCACCGETRFEFLTIDHVNNDGADHRRALEQGKTEFYRWIKKNGFPQEGFRVLCLNCNCSRGWYGYCPHEKEDQDGQPVSRSE